MDPEGPGAAALCALICGIGLPGLEQVVLTVFLRPRGEKDPRHPHVVGDGAGDGEARFGDVLDLNIGDDRLFVVNGGDRYVSRVYFFVAEDIVGTDMDRVRAGLVLVV